MRLHELASGIDAAKNELVSSDYCIEENVVALLKLLGGRMRHVPLTYANARMLGELKKELSFFNRTTRTWKERH